MATKKCLSCLKRKAESQFATRSDNGNLRNQCKKCISGKVRIPKTLSKRELAAQKVGTAKI